MKHGRVIDIFQKRKKPYIHRPLLNRDKRKTKPEKSKNNRHRPRKKEREREFIGNVRKDDAGGQVAKLLYGHVADEAKLKWCDVLRDRMLFHMMSTWLKYTWWAHDKFIVKSLGKVCKRKRALESWKLTFLTFHEITTEDVFMISLPHERLHCTARGEKQQG